jgi:hypothetical protein
MGRGSAILGVKVASDVGVNPERRFLQSRQRQRFLSGLAARQIIDVIRIPTLVDSPLLVEMASVLIRSVIREPSLQLF